MSGIQNVGFNSNSVNFTSNRKVDVDGDKPFQTHAAMKTGAAYMAGTGVSALLLNKIYNATNNAFSEILIESPQDETLRRISDILSRNIKQAKASLKFTLPFLAVGSAVTGWAIDKKINAKHAELKDKLKDQDLATIQAEDNRVKTTKEGNPYYKSVLGKKIGSLVGAVMLPTLAIADKFIMKTPGKVRVLGQVVNGALGGLMLGGITDVCSNRAARKHADKAAQAANVEA